MQKHTTLLLIALAITISGIQCGTKAEWKRRTIYQILTDRFWRTDGSTSNCANIRTYCGGTWRGLINKLSYIQGMGFDAIWISPVPKNTPNGYHGYWQQDLTQLNPHFGTEQDFQDLVSAMHARGMWIMVDVVANHVGYLPSTYGFQIITPFNKAEYYHDYCVIQQSDFHNNQYRVQHCRLAGLPDLNQDNTYVRSYLKNWIHNLVKKYNIDGVRIDTIPEVAREFWTEYSAAAGVFTIGECFDNRLNYVAGYQGAVDAMLNYPLFYTISNVFAHGDSMYEIRTSLNAINKAFPDPSVLGNFIDNQDNTRFLYRNHNVNRLKNALSFTLFANGIPIVYYGTEQGFEGGNDPYNRPPLWISMNPNNSLYKFITTLVKYRKKMQVWNYPYVERYVQTDFYAFSRGKVLIATTNSNAGQTRHAVTYLPFSNGEVVCDVFYGLKDCLTVTGGALQVVLNNGETKIYVPKSML